MASQPEYMELPDETGNAVTEKAMIGIKVRMGAGLPQNKAFKYSAVKEARAIGDITPEENREYLKKEIGLDLSTQPQLTSQQNIHRITSYNVCYTKLLRSEKKPYSDFLKTLLYL